MPEIPRLIWLLELEPTDEDHFTAPNPGEGGGRLYGGQVAAQALRAAAATVRSEHLPHSLHAYFLRPGRYGVPITFEVDRIRDGTSFTTRRVVARQDGEAILNLDASFHKVEEGAAFQLPSPIQDLPDPESLPPRPDRRRLHHAPFDRRPVDLGDLSPHANAHWVRTKDPLPDDPVLHACVLTFHSDSGPVGTTRRALGDDRSGPGNRRLMAASLDHCIWFHRPARCDEWLYYRLDAVAADNSRGLARGEIWTRDGLLVATVTQEALLRRRTR